MPEGWQPGGAAPPVAPPPAAPPVRHGKCSLTLSIGGNEYRLTRGSAAPPIEAVALLRKVGSAPPSGPVAYAIATDGLEIHCTCPDHVHNKSTCKHIMALVAVARILAPLAHAAEGGAL